MYMYMYMDGWMDVWMDIPRFSVGDSLIFLCSVIECCSVLCFARTNLSG